MIHQHTEGGAQFALPGFPKSRTKEPRPDGDDRAGLEEYLPLPPHCSKPAGSSQPEVFTAAKHAKSVNSNHRKSVLRDAQVMRDLQALPSSAVSGAGRGTSVVYVIYP